MLTFYRSVSRRTYAVIAALLLTLSTLVVAAPVTFSSPGSSVTVLGQKADQASARGPVTLYCQSPAPIMRSTYPNWYRMDPCTSYHADKIRAYYGWGFTYYNVSNGGRYTHRCYGYQQCPYVFVPSAGIRVVGVFHL